MFTNKRQTGDLKVKYRFQNGSQNLSQIEIMVGC